MVNISTNINKTITSHLQSLNMLVTMCQQFTNLFLVGYSEKWGFVISYFNKGLSWSWLYGSWIYNYLCNQCLSPLTLWVRTPLRRDILATTLCDKVCQWLATGTLVSSTNKTDCHNITEILLKVALNTINQTLL